MDAYVTKEGTDGVLSWRLQEATDVSRDFIPIIRLDKPMSIPLRFYPTFEKISRRNGPFKQGDRITLQGKSFKCTRVFV